VRLFAGRRARDGGELLEQFGLAGRRRAAFASLSGGERQRLFLVLALLNRPRLVILDELTQGLDPAARRGVWDAIRQLHRGGTTVLLVTHEMAEAEALCDRIMVMRAGRVLDAGTPGELLRRHAGVAADSAVTLVHGDYRLDNLILDPETQHVRAVLDWEMSTLGDPLMDLALLLVYWEQPGDRLRREINVARNLTTTDGFWSRDQLITAYAESTRRPLDHLNVRVALACLKLATVMESIHYRYLSGQALDPLSAGHASAAPALLELGLAAASQPGLTT
jgi:hypothetical protein